MSPTSDKNIKEQINSLPGPQERAWSVLSHLSSLALGMGIVLPILGWSNQRRKSNYASFQNLQALGYQSLGFTVWIFSYLVILILGAIGLLVMLPNDGRAVPTSWLIVFSIVIVGFFALYLLLPIIAAIACAFGKDFRYPILGDRLAHYLAYDPSQKCDEPVWLAEEHEVRWVAAAGHFSILILLWGMLAPLTARILHDERNSFLKFQSVQTLVYQAAVTAFYFIGAGLYGVGLLALLVSMGGIGQPGGSSSPGIFGMVLAGAILLAGSLIILVIPLLHILGQWAGYRVLKGDDYCYPLVGRWVDRWLAKKSVEEKSI